MTAGAPARVSPAIVALMLAAGALVVAGCSGSSKPSATPTVGTAAVTEPRPAGTVSHEGRWLTDNAGRVLMLHGTNMVSKGAPYYPAAAGFDDDDGAWLEANGFDVVRLGVMATALMPEPGKVSQAYLDQIGQTVDMLARHHILVLLDFHQDGWGESVGSDGFPAWMTLTGGAQNTHTDFPLYYVTNPAIQAAFQSFWDNAPGPGGVGIRDQFDAMAAALAKRFGAAPNVLGYDLLNEPWPGTTWEPCGADAGGCPDLDRNELDAFYASATKAIRASDQRHLVFGEPFVLFNFGNAPTNVLLPGGDANAGLSFHVYPLTPDGVPRVLKNAEAWAQSTGGALLETEWGATGDAAVITQQADEFDSALVPWIFWTYDEDLVRDLHKPPAGDNLVASAVGAVVRPHPLAIAGTPTRVHYDPVTRTLEVSWSTTSPDGRQLPAGTVTSIELPASVYTSGYTVTATGAKATSIANATFLTVTNDTGATTVSVTITPAG